MRVDRSPPAGIRVAAGWKGFPALVSVAIALACLPLPAAAQDVGTQAPPLGRKAIDGRFVGLVDWYASKPAPTVLVTFFASWCEPCKKEAPAIAALAKELGPAGLRVVAVGVGEGVEEAAAFARTYYGVDARAEGPFHVVADRQQYLAEQYGVTDRTGQARLPHNFVVDPGRKVIVRSSGWTPDEERKVRNALKTTLTTR
jgi:thiol-disulfide isomerase/thioredoxin